MTNTLKLKSAMEKSGLSQGLIAELLGISSQVLEAKVNGDRECLNCMQGLKQRLILTFRYIHFMLWEDITKEMRCEERQVFRLHKEGLTELAEILTVRGII